MSDHFNGDLLRIPVLGRNFALGTLYDVRSGMQDNTVCDAGALGALKTTGNEGAHFSLIPSDKLTDKLDDLGVSDWHRITMVTDNVAQHGSFNYLKKKKSEFHECSVHVRCHYRTATRQFEECNMDRLKVAAIGDTAATHVITKIQYGAEATFTLTQQLDETEDERVACSRLKNCANHLIELLRGGPEVGEGDTTALAADVKCRFDGDFLLATAFATYEKATEFAKGFLHLLSNSIPKQTLDGSEVSLGTACFAWLHPLAPMHDDASAPASQISDDAVIECLQQMEDYDEVEAKLDYLLDDRLAMKLCPLNETLRVLRQRFIAFRHDHRAQLKDLVANSHHGLVQTGNLLAQLMQRVDNEQFDFNRQRLASCLDEKYRELCLMRKYHDLIAAHAAVNSERVVFFPCAEKLQEHMTKRPVNFGFELALTWPSNGMADRNRTTDGVTREIEWRMRRIEKEIAVVARLIESKQNDDKFAFAVTALHQPIETLEWSIIVHQGRKKSYGWSAIDTVGQHYPKLNLIDMVRLISDADIPDYWNGINFLALCRFYDQKNLIDMIRLFLERGVDLVNCKTDDGWNGLLLVCRYYGHDNLLDIGRLLLARGVDVNCKTNGGLNALHLVCRYYDKDNLIDIVRLFFERGIDVNCHFEDGWNAFLFFCRNYQRDNLLGIIRLFIGQKVDVHYETRGGNSALLFLCRYYGKKNLIDIIRLLLERGVNVNCKNDQGWNALYLVCRYYERPNLIDIVRLLLRKGIDVNCNNSHGWNSLHLVCRYYQRDNLIGIIELLLDQNIEINCKTNSGCNALHNVCRYYPNGDLIDIVRLLLDGGVFASFTNNEGCNALLNVCKYYANDDLIHLVRLFLDEGIDVNWANNDGCNALHLTCRYYKQDNVVDIVRLLLDNGIDVNSATNDGCNALHFVSARYYQNDNLIETVQLLVDSGISVNCTNKDGWNALHNVCRYQPKKKMMQLIPLLMQHNIKRNAVTSASQTVNARTVLLGRYKQENVREILHMLDSHV